MHVDQEGEYTSSILIKLGKDTDKVTHKSMTSVRYRNV